MLLYTNPVRRKKHVYEAARQSDAYVAGSIHPGRLCLLIVVYDPQKRAPALQQKWNKVLSFK
jgi:hypothetical protein